MYPTRPLPYDETALPGRLSASEKEMRHKKQKATNIDQIVHFDVFEACETHFKEQIAVVYD